MWLTYKRLSVLLLLALLLAALIAQPGLAAGRQAQMESERGSLPAIDSQQSTPLAPTETPEYGILTSTPDALGATYHIVQPGESLFAIADAYDMTTDVLMTLNYLTAGSVIQPGNRLLIDTGYTPTPSGTPTRTATSIPPTSTRRPTRTATAPSTQAPPTATPTAQPLPSQPFPHNLAQPILWLSGLSAVLGVVLTVAGLALRLRRP